MEWKESLLKSIIYRIITLLLGGLISFFITGSAGQALLLTIVIESVQFVNYFVYETIWTNLRAWRLKQKIKEEAMREIALTLDFESLKEISYELSRIDTFVNDIYISIINFYNRVLANESLKDIHDEVREHKKHFETIHSGRNFKEPELPAP
ncbi:MAG: DUF2061 domain-containing protein [Candidatus Lokiarchaeota archaeon]